MNENKKHYASAMQNPWVLLVMGIVLAAVTYVGFVWATDSGRLVAYLLTFTSVFYAVRFTAKGVKTLINRN